MFLRHQTGCVSQTGEAELAAREIAPQLQTLEITGHGDTGTGWYSWSRARVCRMCGDRVMGLLTLLTLLAGARGLQQPNIIIILADDIGDT